MMMLAMTNSTQKQISNEFIAESWLVINPIVVDNLKNKTIKRISSWQI